MSAKWNDSLSKVMQFVNHILDPAVYIGFEKSKVVPTTSSLAGKLNDLRDNIDQVYSHEKDL